MPIELPEVPVEQLARTRPPLLDNVGRHDADRIAALAYELQRVGLPVFAVVPPYAELSDETREGLRAHAMRTLQALVMLGWIDLPS